MYFDTSLLMYCQGLGEKMFILLLINGTLELFPVNWMSAVWGALLNGDINNLSLADVSTNLLKMNHIFPNRLFNEYILHFFQRARDRAIWKPRISYFL